MHPAGDSNLRPDERRRSRSGRPDGVVLLYPPEDRSPCRYLRSPGDRTGRAKRGQRRQINVVATPVGTTLRAVPAINRRLPTENRHDGRLAMVRAGRAARAAALNDPASVLSSPKVHKYGR